MHACLVGRFYHSARYRWQARSNVVIGKLRDYFPTAFPLSLPPPNDLAGLISAVLSLSRDSFISLEGVFIPHSDHNVLSLGRNGPTTCGLEFIRGSSTENVSDISRKLYNINLGIRYVVMYGLPYVFLSLTLSRRHSYSLYLYGR